MKTYQRWIKSLGLLFFCLSFSLYLSAQRTNGSGNVIEQDRDISNFDAIKVQDGIDLFLSQGNTNALTVKADDNLMDHIITKVEGNTLYLKIKGSINNTKALDVYVTFQDLKALHASGGSDVVGEEILQLDDLKLNCSGGSDTHLELEVGALSCETSGGSDLVLSGSAQNLELNASGGSDFKGKDLEVKNAKIHTSGASDARIHVTGEVEMIASGASDIYCTGNPKVLLSKASGGADIHHR